MFSRVHPLDTQSLSSVFETRVDVEVLYLLINKLYTTTMYVIRRIKFSLTQHFLFQINKLKKMKFQLKSRSKNFLTTTLKIELQRSTRASRTEALHNLA